MKLIYIHQYFKTPEEGGAIRSYYIARHRVAAGDEVHMLCAGNTQGVTIVYGITVHRLRVPYNSRMNYLSRLYAFVAFVIKAWMYAAKLPKADMIYATSTPLTVGLIALLFSRKMKAPYIFEVRDLWPDVPAAMGLLKLKPLYAIAKQLEKWIYRNAKGIVVLSPEMENHLLNYSPNKNIMTVPNMADTEYFEVGKPTNSEQLTIVYTGSTGPSHGVLVLAAYAAHCEKLFPGRTRFVMVGEHMENLKILCRNLTNVHFPGFLDKKGIKDLLKGADMALVSYASVPLLHTGSPNKMFDALAAGVPVVSNFSNQMMELVCKAHAGYVVKSEDAFAELVGNVLEGKPCFAEKNEIRYFAEKTFDKKIHLERISQFIQQAVG